MKEELSEFKVLARNAKNRLRSGFWNDIKTQKLSEDIPKIAKEDLKNKIFSKTYDEDEAFYKKVCEILSSSELVTNPIYILADKEYLKICEPNSKQVYLSQIAEKYQQMTERYLKEHIND